MDDVTTLREEPSMGRICRACQRGPKPIADAASDQTKKQAEELFYGTTVTDQWKRRYSATDRVGDRGVRLRAALKTACTNPSFTARALITSVQQARAEAQGESWSDHSGHVSSAARSPAQDWFAGPSPIVVYPRMPAMTPVGRSVRPPTEGGCRTVYHGADAPSRRRRRR